MLARLSLVCHRLGRRMATSSASTHRLVMHPLWVCLSCSVNHLWALEKPWDCVRHHRKQVTTMGTCDGFFSIPTAQDCLICLVFMIAHLCSQWDAIRNVKSVQLFWLFLQPAYFLISCFFFFNFFFNLLSLKTQNTDPFNLTRKPQLSETVARCEWKAYADRGIWAHGSDFLGQVQPHPADNG